VSTSSVKREVPGVDGASGLKFEAVYRENIGPVTAFAPGAAAIPTVWLI
jgi:hypothetical protein